MTASPMTLVSHILCPFVQRAAIVLHEKGISFERIDIDLASKPDWFMHISPMGKVPILAIRQHHEFADVLFESMAICEYLEERFPVPRLHPEDALLRAKHRGWIEFASAMLGDAWGFLNAGDVQTAQAKRQAFREKLERFDAEIVTGPYFSGANFSMVDVVVAPVFRYFNVLDADIGAPLFEGLQQVSAWRAALACRPSVMAAVSPDYGNRLKSHLHHQGALLFR